MTHTTEILGKLRGLARPDQLAGMAKFGMAGENRLGIAIPELRKLASSIGRDHALALELWDTDIPEARILAAMIADPEKLTRQQMDAWVQGFNSWDVCDQVCMNLFDKTPLAWECIQDWANQESEFVRRAAFALIACLAWHEKSAPDQAFIELIPLIKNSAGDTRPMVKKAVSWALRQIGKRNPRLHQIALQTAGELCQQNAKSARWIGNDARRDLNSPASLRRLAKQRGSAP